LKAIIFKYGPRKSEIMNEKPCNCLFGPAGAFEQKPTVMDQNERKIAIETVGFCLIFTPLVLIFF